MARNTANRIHRAARKQQLLGELEDAHAKIAELAEATDIPRPTVRDLVAELRESGRIKQVDEDRSEGGNPAPIYTLADDARAPRQERPA